MEIIKTTEQELELLREHKKKAANNLIKDRAHTIILNHKGYNAEQIADILDRGIDTIIEWLGKWNTNRISSIFTHYDENSLNNSAFTKEQLEEIKTTLENPPTVKHLKNYLNAKYSIVFESERSYHHLLEINNYSFKLPEGFNKNRNDELIAKRMLEIQGIIEKHKDTHEILFADECSLYFATEYKRAWLKKGETTVLKVNTSLERQNYFGAWNISSKKEHLINLTWQNTGTIILALEELIKLYPNKKLMIIWDNAGWHKSKELKSHLGPGNKFENILLVNMPTYAPDHNPQERIWKAGKSATQNESPKTFEEVKKLFEETIQNQIFDYTY
jgi:transposase